MNKGDRGDIKIDRREGITYVEFSLEDIHIPKLLPRPKTQPKGQKQNSPKRIQDKIQIKEAQTLLNRIKTSSPKKEVFDYQIKKRKKRELQWNSNTDLPK